MAIEDILKPKSKNEIDDLEKRGFRYNKGKWKFVIDISAIVDIHKENGDNNKFKERIIRILKNKIKDIEIYASSEEFENFKKIISKFKEIHKEDIDFAMKELYDWADENNVWIESSL
jgi:hypothetical protein